MVLVIEAQGRERDVIVPALMPAGFAAGAVALAVVASMMFGICSRTGSSEGMFVSMFAIQEKGEL